jgi:isopenicillin-N epimerase
MDRRDWTIDPDVTYLNHGSFGPSPSRVQEVRRAWTERLETQPMQFLTRDMEPALSEAMEPLARFVGAEAKDLTFVDNATFGMNAVARTLQLSKGDEVLFTDHEYGAVMRIWRERCKEAGAHIVVRRLPDPLSDRQQLIDQFLEGISERTKMIVISHVTSATAAILPIEDICRAARRIKLPVCIDGPHAVAMTPLNLAELDCDFYCASCHKWLCAPFGTGFLYVAPRWQHRIKPAIVSWGGSVSGRDPSWQDEFNWVGTRDVAGFLAIPEAIACLKEHGIDAFRQQCHELVVRAGERIAQLTGMAPLLPVSTDWIGTMMTLPIPGEVEEGQQHGRRDPLQVALWERFKIEIPVYTWKGRRFLRVSCHLYNTEKDIDKLESALKTLLPEFS